MDKNSRKSKRVTWGKLIISYIETMKASEE